MCGIKWRVYSWECLGAGSSEPLEDPVLLSYSRCLSADVLCVWRRTWKNPTRHAPSPPLGDQSTSPHHHSGPGGQGVGAGGGPNSQQNTHRPPLKFCPKELWVFWYGDEPNLSTLVSPELTKGGEYSIAIFNISK